MADRIHEIEPIKGKIEPIVTNNREEVPSLRRELKELKRIIKEGTTRQYTNNKFSQVRSRSKSRERRPVYPNVCWYYE